MKILWLSRHDPTDRQREELKRLFGDYQIVQDVNRFADAADVKRRIFLSGASEAVCICPLTVLKKLLEFGLRPLTAKMVQCPEDEAEVHTSGRHYKFLRFQRLVALDMRYEEVEPCPAGQMK